MKVKVEEYPHAYLVRGTTNIAKAKRAVWKHLGQIKADRINQMPARPLWTGEFGDPKPVGAVALYFSIAGGDDKKYKP